MIKGVKQRWQALERGRPGHRFQDEFRRRHEPGANPVRRILVLSAGVAVLAVGIFFLPAPGPGVLIVAFGAGLLAQESKLAARALDWTELRIRRLANWALTLWRRAPLAGKAALALTVLAAAAGAGYVGYRLFLG